MSFTLCTLLTPSENKVKEFWTNNLLRYYVDQEVFDQCYGRIKHWLDVNTLVGYMMKHGLISSPAEMEKITSPYFLPEQRQNSLLSLANSRGEYGFFLLYMCIKESVDENPHGHGDAVRVLEAEGRSVSIVTIVMGLGQNVTFQLPNCLCPKTSNVSKCQLP